MTLEEDIKKYNDVKGCVDNFIASYEVAHDDYVMYNVAKIAHRFIDSVYTDKKSYHNKAFKEYFDQVSIRRRIDYKKATQSPYDASQGGWSKLKR